jgi:hypothetical protein
MRSTQFLLPATALLFAAFAVVPNVAAESSPQAQVPPYPPSVTVLDQELKNDEVSITYAFLPKNGKLTIFSGDPEETSDASVIGSVELQAGDHRQVKVPVTNMPGAGTQLWAKVEEGKGDSVEPFSEADERAHQSFKTL